MPDEFQALKKERCVEIIKACNGSGVPKRQWCREHGISNSTFMRWQRSLRNELAGEIMAYFTDIGHLSSEILRAMSGCKRIVIESNHDVERLKAGPYPFPLKKRILGPYGHLSNFDCAALLPHLVRYGTQRIVLAHLSEENNTPEMAYEESARRLEGAASLAVAKPAETVEV